MSVQTIILYEGSGTQESFDILRIVIPLPQHTHLKETKNRDVYLPTPIFSYRSIM